MTSGMRACAVVLTILLAVAACSGQGQATPPAATPAPEGGPVVSATGKVVPARWAALSVSAPGIADELQVTEGQVVAAGDLLVRLRGDDARAALEQARAGQAAAEANLARAEAGARAPEVAAAEAALRAAQALAAQAEEQRNALAAGARPDEIAIAQADVAAAEAQLRYAEAIHDATMALPHGGPKEWEARQQRDMAAAALDAARARLNLLKLGAAVHDRRATEQAVQAAQAQVAQAQAQLDLLKAGATAEELEALRAAVAQARAQVAAAEVTAANLELRAPFAGTVSAVYIRAHEWVSPGQPVLLLAELSTLRVETTDLNEIDAARVAVGDAVKITFDALPGVALEGVVARIAPKAAAGSGVNYTAVVELQNPPDRVRWDMTAFVDITVKP